MRFSPERYNGIRFWVDLFSQPTTNVDLLPLLKLLLMVSSVHVAMKITNYGDTRTSTIFKIYPTQNGAIPNKVMRAMDASRTPAFPNLPTDFCLLGTHVMTLPNAT